MQPQLAAATVIAGLTLVPPAAAAATCDSLTSLKLPHTTIDSAQLVAAGAFEPPGGRGVGAAQRAELQKLPAFCRVAATARPTSDSEIKIEVWMPASGWNGKYLAVGNGGWTGSIAYNALIEMLGRGYATSSTDTGHEGGSAEFALGHPEKLIDFGYRSIQEMSTVAKQAITTFYGSAPRYSYWSGCSAGGRQGLQAAQRFPDEFDGIIAGAPGHDWTGRAGSALRVWRALNDNPAGHIPADKYPLLHDAALQACDRNDGVADGVIENPSRCQFDPGVLLCEGKDEGDCLTAAQVETARQIYASPANPRTGRPIPGLQPGSERGWSTWGGQRPFGTALDLFRYVVFQDPNWQVEQFDFARDLPRAEEGDRNTTNALNPDLSAFFKSGGKLLQYHGWNDPQIAPGSSVQYYDRVVERAGDRSRVHDSYRLFMVPGMAHCGGGEGPNRFDMVAALERWVEQGQAPDRIVATRPTETGVRSRPLCAWPQTAHYTGSGSTDDAANFVCK
jgi:feruloyl esterase